MAQEEKSSGSIRAVAVQASPVFLNSAATTQKVCDLILRAGKIGADIIGFPEGFIPGHPTWIELIALRGIPAESLYVKLFNEAIVVPGPETALIGEACKEAHVCAVVGVNEKRANTTGTMWNSSLFFGSDGSLLHKHQKIVATVGERLIHAPGETGSDATAVGHFGRFSSLICGENGNPLAQYAISLDYPVVHVALWPPHLTLDINVGEESHALSAATAKSVGCYVIISVAVVGDDIIAAYGTTDEIKEFLRAEQGKRHSSIIEPGGSVLSHNDDTDEELVYADLELDLLKRNKYSLDYAGHYNRPEVFAHLFKKHMK